MPFYTHFMSVLCTYGMALKSSHSPIRQPRRQEPPVYLLPHPLPLFSGVCLPCSCHRRHILPLLLPPRYCRAAAVPVLPAAQIGKKKAGAFTPAFTIDFLC